MTIICRFLSLCAVGIAGYALYLVKTLIDAQEEINTWTDEGLMNHKEVIEQHGSYLRNHHNRIIDIYSALKMDMNGTYQVFGDYSKEIN